MRLIDADKLEVKHFVQRTEKIIGYDGTQPRYELKDVLAYAIDDAPTVKAITIEWLREYCKYNHTPDGMDWHKAVDLIIKRWEKENETN